GVADLAGHAAAELQADLRQLRGLAGTRLARDDHYLVIADDLGDLVLQLADRKLRRVGDHGRRAPALLDAGRCRVQFRDDLADCLLARPGVAECGDPLDAPAQPALIVQHQPRQAGFQRAERGCQGSSLHCGRGSSHRGSSHQGWSGSPRRPNAFAARLLPRRAALPVRPTLARRSPRTRGALIRVRYVRPERHRCAFGVVGTTPKRLLGSFSLGHTPRRNAWATGPALSAPRPPPSTSTANARSPR